MGRGGGEGEPPGSPGGVKPLAPSFPNGSVGDGTL